MRQGTKQLPHNRPSWAARLTAPLALLAGLATVPAIGQTQAPAQPQAPAPTSAQVSTPAATPVVTTAYGPVQGLMKNGVNEFLGIPYAAPPVGPLRWMPPQVPASWTQTKQTTAFGNTCGQLDRGIFAAPSNHEDCLYLNVYTPKAGDAGKRAVMVWFYGGGLFSGESNDYDGWKLANRGSVVVVTLNYRVGALGFFSHPAINAEGHPYANYGIMDQQFALKWVKQNIAGFGGDPNNVTIFGQSGGGTAVMANLISPTAAGLFQKAINESGTHIEVYDPKQALRNAEDLAKAAGCADQSAACLRALPVAQVLKYQQVIVKDVVNDFPQIDGTVITHNAFDGFSHGQFNHVPILTGLVADEQSFFMPEIRTHKPLTAAGYAQYAASFGAQHADKLKAQYPLASYASPTLAEIAMAEGFKACTARQLDRAWTRYVPVYAYQFSDRTAPSYYPPLSYPMRAYHTAELEYLFPLFHGSRGTPHPLNAAQTQLSDRLVDYWTNFAKTGNPNEPKRTPFQWLRYAPAKDDVFDLNLGKDKVMARYGEAYDCKLWDQVVNRS
ncbi:MAG TPA: carboxylesterase family protein [Stellaceae bacterium]|nr:carboxylesterase family protein [Stellaceae bacterium]